MSNNEFRPINRAVGLAPLIGRLAFYQIVPVLGITIGMYYLKTLVGWSWLLTAIIWGILTGCLLAVLPDFSQNLRSQNTKALQEVGLKRAIAARKSSTVCC